LCFTEGERHGNAFEKAVGPSRHVGIEDLGNRAIVEGGEMQIKNPQAAGQLLDRAAALAQEMRRVLFFCACEFPGTEANRRCHRTRVATHLLEFARQRGVAPQVAEWPGGEPDLDGFEVQVPAPVFGKLRRPKSIPLGAAPVAEFAGLPWGSLAVVSRDSDDEPYPFAVVTGPARYKDGGWYLPIFGEIDLDATEDEVRREVEAFRREDGFTTRQAW
jgi:hypothetical protein